MPPDPPERRSEVGRYTIVRDPSGQRDSKLLDTVTGRSWQLVEANGEWSWQPITGVP